MSRILVALVSATAVALGLIPAAAQAATKSRSNCDQLDPRSCLLPWPNNRYTVSDARTDTERRVSLRAADMPVSAKRVRIAPTEFNRADGFSPGSPIVTYVPGLDLKKTGAVPVTDLRRSLDRSQPIAVVNARTGARQLIWAEIDSTSDPNQRLLIIHPARNLSRGQRYIVALSRLRDKRGRLIAARKPFRVLRDGLKTKSLDLSRRRKAYSAMFKTLAKAGVKRPDVYLAWDFTIASTRNITERALVIRDNAFTVLGDKNFVDHKPEGRAPAFTLAAAQEFAPCGADGCQAGENDLIWRTVTGKMTVACYLDRKGCPVGSRYRYQRLKRTATFKADRFVYVPSRIKGNTMQVPFTCIVPRAAIARRSRLALFGHAPFSGQDDVLAPAVQQLAQEGNITFCAPRQAGTASEDAATLDSAFANLNRFPEVADRLQQGALNTLMLGRLMIHPTGLSTQAAFRNATGPAIDIGDLSYDTISGGQFGGMVTALAPDFQRASLGAGGMNQSLMMPRSTAFAAFETTFRKTYPSRLTRMLVLSMLQGQWDRAEANGYAQSMTGDPLANTPLHTVLFQLALGDHRVPQVSVEVEARSIKAVVRAPMADAGRSLDIIPAYDIAPAAQLELGSVLTVWDGGPIRAGGTLGTAPAPAADVPPTTGVDPHDLPSLTVAALQQRSAFLRSDSRFIDTCPVKRGCRAFGWGY